MTKPDVAAPLGTLARFIRSKNAGPFELTFDIIFDDPVAYRRVESSQILSPSRVAEAFNCPVERIYEIVFFEPALAVKITMARPVPSGDPRDSDVYGAQQHVPLLSIPVPSHEDR